MGKPLSIDLRSRLIAAVAGGMSRRSAAERFGVSAASAVRWVQAVNATGTVQAKPQGGYPSAGSRLGVNLSPP
jgi:transposase